MYNNTECYYHRILCIIIQNVITGPQLLITHMLNIHILITKKLFFDRPKSKDLDSRPRGMKKPYHKRHCIACEGITRHYITLHSPNF